MKESSAWEEKESSLGQPCGSIWYVVYDRLGRNVGGGWEEKVRGRWKKKKQTACTSLLFLFTFFFSGANDSIRLPFDVACRHPTTRYGILK